MFLRGEKRAFSGKKPRDHAHSCSPQMRKGRNRANSDLLFVSADDLEKNPEHENEPRRQPKPAKIIKVTPQKADFRLRNSGPMQCARDPQCGKTTCGFGFGNGRACSVCVSPASNQTNSQIRQTSILVPLLLSRATSNIPFPQDGQGRALLPSWWIACNQSGLIDSGVKVRRSSCRPTARPSHFSQRQMMPLPVRNSVNGIRQAGQKS